MAEKSWRLVVTDLGSSAALAEVTVEANNWMSALTAARLAIGESGGVPPGASCTVDPAGTVTIHDAGARKTYALAPLDGGAEAPSDAGAPDAAPAAPAASVAASAPASGRRAAKQTIAYNAADLGIAPAAASAQKKKAKQTVAYNAADLGLTPPTAPGAAPAPPSAENPPEGKSPSIEGGTPATPPAAAEPGPASRKPKHTVAYRAEDLNLVPPAAVAVGQPTPNPSEPAATVDPNEWQILHQRDEDPSDESPLTYRERVYFCPEELDEIALEAALSARFGQVAGDIDHLPKGKLINLAVFDHAWTERPERPPLLTLQWKDWRGDPIFVRSDDEPPPPDQPTDHPLVTEAGSAATQSASAAPAVPADPTWSAPANPGSDSASPPWQPPAQGPPSDELQLEISDDVIDGSLGAPSSVAAGALGDDRLAVAFEVLQDLFFLASPHEGLEFVLRLLADLVPSEASSACLYDINTDEFRFVALHGLGGKERQGEAVPRVLGLCGAAAKSPGETMVVANVMDDPRFDPGVDGRVGIEPNTMAVTSVAYQGRLLGILQLINRKVEVEFTGSDVNVLNYVGEKLAEYLHQLRLRSDAQRN